MGVSLAKVVLSATWAHLPPPARVLFAHMAVVAQDQAKEPVYFGGRDALVLALDGELDEDPDERESQYRRLRRHLEYLKAAGAIRTDHHAHRRKRAEYVIQVVPKADIQRPPLTPVKEVAQRPPKPERKGDTERPLEEVTERPPFDEKGGHLMVERGTPSVPPRNNEEQLQDEDLSGGGIEPVSAQPYLGAPEAPRDKRERCAKCGRSERDCRARSARHGAHDYEAVELTPLRLA